MIKKIKTYVNGYLEIWKSLFDNRKTITKNNFIRFVWFNVLCILIVSVKISNLVKDDGGLTYTILFLLFLVTYTFALLKIDIPNLSTTTVLKIIFIAILVAVINCYSLLVENSESLNLGGLILLCVYFIIVITFVLIAFFFINTLRKTPITNVSLIVYFFILLIVTNILVWGRLITIFH